MTFFVHESSCIDDGVTIGDGTKIWHFSHVQEGAVIGEDCTLGQNVYVGKDVKIGRGCKIQNNVSIYDGVTLEDYVFCGPSCVFTNDLTPRSEFPKGFANHVKTLVKRGASIGANATIVCGVTIGEYAMIGAGAVVTRDVPAYTLVIGTQQKIYKPIDKYGYSPERRRIEFRDLKAQYQALRPEIDAAIQSVLTDGHYISGSQVALLEKKLADYAGVKHCITCANGTDALVAALMTLGIGPGDAVFVPDFTFFASAEAPAFLGAAPVFTDVNADTYNLDPNSLEQAVEQVKRDGQLRPAAVIAVDLFGQIADYDAIRRIAEKYGMPVIEDAAQAFGAECQGRKACSFGDISTTSFFPAKPLGCYGDGGAIFTDNDKYAEVIRSICVHGKGSDKYHNVRIGMNSRLDTIQAAILLVKLKAFREFELESVQKAAGLYDKLLPAGLKRPVIPDGHLSSWAQYTIRLDNEERRDRLAGYLRQFDIPSMVYYPVPLHMQPGFYGKCQKTDTPVTEGVCRQVLSLPVGPYTSQESVTYICKKMEEFMILENKDGRTERDLSATRFDSV